MTRAAPRFRDDDLDAAVFRAREPLADLRGGRLFVTGGTGFIGRWLLATIARANIGCEVVALTRDARGFLARNPAFAPLKGLRLVEGDIASFEFPEGEFTHVIHAATDTSADADSRPRELADSIMSGTRRVLEFCERARAKNCLYVSSGAVYGRQPADMERIPETFSGSIDPLDPRAVYGESKRAAEMMCAIAARASDMAIPIARVFAAAGPGLPLDGHFAIGNFVRDALAGRDIHISGDGTPLRTYLYAGDLAAWLLTLLTRGRSAVACNVGSDAAISIGDLATGVRDLLAPRARVIIAGRPDPAASRSRYTPSIERARSEWGLDAWTPLDVAIQRMAEFSRS